MQFFKGEDDTRNNESDIWLQVGSKVSGVLQIVREDIEVNVIGEVEIEAQICIVFVEVQTLDDKGRIVVGCY